MNRTEFINLLERLQARELEINLIKGRDYADGDASIGNNFNECAAFLGLNPLQICLSYMAKHLSAIKNLANGGTLRSDDLEERIADIRLYSALFLALAEAAKGDKMTPEELLEEIDAARTNEAALDILRAAATQYYDDGYAAGTRDSFPTAHMDADKPARLPEPDPALNAYMG